MFFCRFDLGSFHRYNIHDDKSEYIFKFHLEFSTECKSGWIFGKYLTILPNSTQLRELCHSSFQVRYNNSVEQCSALSCNEHCTIVYDYRIALYILRYSVYEQLYWLAKIVSAGSAVIALLWRKFKLYYVLNCSVRIPTTT